MQGAGDEGTFKELEEELKLLPGGRIPLSRDKMEEQLQAEAWSLNWPAL